VRIKAKALKELRACTAQGSRYALEGVHVTGDRLEASNSRILVQVALERDEETEAPIESGIYAVPRSLPPSGRSPDNGRLAITTNGRMELRNSSGESACTEPIMGVWPDTDSAWPAHRRRPAVCLDAIQLRRVLDVIIAADTSLHTVRADFKVAYHGPGKPLVLTSATVRALVMPVLLENPKGG
jgi:hypothetical protein